jgi:Uma2 family endonuclease
MPVDFYTGDLIETVAPPAPESPPRKRWTRAECELIDAMGVWEGQHLELIEGELIDKKMAKNPPHVTAVLLLREWAIAVFGSRQVLQEAPIDVAAKDNPTNQPEPDLVVLRQSALRFTRTGPGPADIALVVDVSDSTLCFDLNKKAPLYARAGIQEYWVLDVNLRRLIVHREPADGKYHFVKIYHEHESVAPLAASGSEFQATQAFPEGK